ncbi:FabD/lysophospholipase-like protein [Xylaria telfairii]|nr:FabD/lysophospholipase-like protein [Xylaria telfairii]
MPGHQVRLLVLDDGGVRGLSSLLILQQLMANVDPASPPKPCEYFNMIGGTSTGGLIAIMLGRLQMTVGECIDAYTSLADKVFEKKHHRVNLKGKLQGRFDTAAPELAIKQILKSKGLREETLLKDSDANCKVFVCATSKQTADAVCLTSYQSPRGGQHLFDSARIWEVCRATSAATSFFDPIAIGPFEEEFVDGALGANNPVNMLWSQAQDIWGDQLRTKLQYLVPIGAGVPALKPVRDDVLGIWATLKELATETERTAEQFRRDKSDLDNEGRYYRFNVDRGLEDIVLGESKKKDMAAATSQYIASQAVFRQMKGCANALARRDYHGPYRTVFTLQDTRIFVLYGLGEIGKTQLAVDFARRHKAAFSSVFWLDGRPEERPRQSLAGCAKRIPEGQIAERYRAAILDSRDDIDTAVAKVLKWLGRPDNVGWLLIFDNVNLDYERDSKIGGYDVRRYLPGDHGLVLITSRLAQLSHLGASGGLGVADGDLEKAIFENWFKADLVIDDASRQLLKLLKGLPLVLAQAASYLREVRLPSRSYFRLYKERWGDLMKAHGESGSPLMIEKGNPNATNVVRLWAFLDNKDVKSDWPEWLYDIACDEVKFLEATRLLLRYSMIGPQESTQGSYSVHPVVHQWPLHILDDVDKRSSLRLAMATVGYSVPRENNRSSWGVERRLIPHAEMSKTILSRALEGYQKARGPKHMDTLRTVCNLGVVYIWQGRLDEAETIFSPALESYEKILGPEHIETRQTIYNLGNIYMQQGRLEEAETIISQALEGRERDLEPKHMDTLQTVCNLGILYTKQGRLDEAYAMFNRALDGCQAI